MDSIDRAQTRQLEDMEFALAARGKVAVRGPATCESADCDEQISEVRRDLGARRCLHHQHLLEQGAKPWHIPVERSGRNR